VNDVKVLAVDLAKHVFQLHGVNEHGEVVLQRRLSRGHLPAFPASTLEWGTYATAQHYEARQSVLANAPDSRCEGSTAPGAPAH
jgi:transposase